MQAHGLGVRVRLEVIECLLLGGRERPVLEADADVWLWCRQRIRIGI